jgi:hypothetical protein
MATDNYQEYHGQDVIIVLDGRGAGYEKNLALYLKANLVEETDISLKLENVLITNSGMMDYLHHLVPQNKNCNEFARATIQKEYIMGIFQWEIPKNDALYRNDNNLNNSG